STIGVSFSRKTVTATVGGKAVPATLFTFSLDLSQGCLVAGTLDGCGSTATGSGLAVGGTPGAGTLTVATPAPTDTTDTRRWIAVEGKNLSASLVIPGVTAHVTEIDVALNSASGTTPLLDWSTALGADAVPGIDLTPTTPFAVSGTVDLTIAG